MLPSTIAFSSMATVLAKSHSYFVEQKSAIVLSYLPCLEIRRDSDASVTFSTSVAIRKTD